MAIEGQQHPARHGDRHHP